MSEKLTTRTWIATLPDDDLDLLAVTFITATYAISGTYGDPDYKPMCLLQDDIHDEVRRRGRDPLA